MCVVCRASDFWFWKEIKTLKNNYVCVVRGCVLGEVGLGVGDGTIFGIFGLVPIKWQSDGLDWKQQYIG